MASQDSNELSYVPDGGRIIAIKDTIYNPTTGRLEDNAGSTQFYLVYTMPGSDTDMGWAVTAETLDANGQPSVYFSGTDRKLSIAATYNSRSEFISATDGKWAEWGTTEELGDFEESHPFEKWKRDIDAAAVVQPWLKDPEVLQVYFNAYAEGRTPESWELAQTSWYQTHSKTERQWLSLFSADPKTAKQLMEDQRGLIKSYGTQYGLSEGLTNWIADQMTTGKWSEQKTRQQITALIDPYSGIKKDAGMIDFLQTQNFQTPRYIRKYEDEVKDIIYDGLGPAFAKGFTSKDIAKWAGEFRNDPDNARVRLNEYIDYQMKVVFGDKYPPGYTYSQIAQPWKNYTYGILGGYMDERDPAWIEILQKNDSVEASKIAKKYGLEKGFKKVLNDFEGSMVQNMGLQRIRTTVG